MKVVVETNVTIAANGRDTHANEVCQLHCIEFLEKLVSQQSPDLIILDDQGIIVDEYKRYLNYKGQPGVGDIFFKYLHDNMYLDGKIKLVSITPDADETRGFVELPPNPIDKSDQKFLAVALVSAAYI